MCNTSYSFKHSYYIIFFMANILPWAGVISSLAWTLLSIWLEYSIYLFQLHMLASFGTFFVYNNKHLHLSLLFILLLLPSGQVPYGICAVILSFLARFYGKASYAHSRDATCVCIFDKNAFSFGLLQMICLHWNSALFNLLYIKIKISF